MVCPHVADDVSISQQVANSLEKHSFWKMIFDLLKVSKIVSHYNQQHYKGLLSYQLQGDSENLAVWNDNLYV